MSQCDTEAMVRARSTKTCVTEPPKGEIVRAVVTDGDGTVNVVDVPAPEILEPGDVILHVTAAAICGTDVHFIKAPILGPDVPLGHEFLGIVHEVGPGVKHFAVGDRAKSRMFVSCGNCASCLSGGQIRCPEYALFGGPSPSGAPLPGGQADFVRIPYADRTLTPIPEGVDDGVALLLTDTLPTAWEAVMRAGEPAGKSFTVVGAGPVGQQVIAVAYALGASIVYAVDLDDRRLDAAAALGAVPVSGNGDPGARILELTKTGTDVAVDAVGSQGAIDTAMKAVTPGGVVALVGAMLSGVVTFNVEYLSHKGVDILPVMGNPYVSERNITPLLENGRLNLAGLVDLELPLEAAAEGYEAFASRRVNKVVLRPGA